MTLKQDILTALRATGLRRGYGAFVRAVRAA